MKKSVLIITTLILVFCGHAIADDWEYWNTFVVESDISERSAVFLEIEQKLYDDISDLYLYNAALGASYSFTDWLFVGTEYLREEEKDDDEWGTEDRYSALFGLKRKLLGCSLKLKNKLEYRHYEEKDRWRIRSKFYIKRKFHIGELEVTPFVTEEPFWDLEGDHFNKNRSSLGATIDLLGVELSLYYLNEAAKSADEWKTTNVVGTELTVKF